MNEDNKILRLLIVEDSPDDAELTILELESQGYQVEFTCLSSLSEFRDELQNHEYHVILCDYNLDGFTGLDFLAIYREMPIDTPFIMVSGESGEEVAVGAMREGAHDYILKHKISRLVPAIEREIREHRNRKNLRRTEQELMKQNIEYQTLNAELKRLNAGFKEAKEKAEESDKLKSAFLANMSHEIRTPMNGILGFAELLKRQNLSGEEQKEYLDIIHKSGQRMLNIINDIVDISKIETGQVEIAASEFQVNPLMEELYQFFKPEAEFRNLTLSYENGYENSGPQIFADRDRVHQILTNLIKNSLKFTKSGGVKFLYDLKGEVIVFSVSDTGIGVPEDLKDSIFERFRQADNFFERSYEGAGLGLSISKAYVEAHGGDIWVDNNETGGATFSFSIPVGGMKDLQKTEEEGVGMLSEEADFSEYNLSLLIVEDDDINYMLIKELLKINGLKMHRAENGKQAVDMVKEQTFDLLLMDIKMPVMDGVEATRIIKSMMPELPIIVQTAFAMKGDEERARAAGCDDFITKPFSSEQLVGAIQNCLPDRILS